LVAEIRADPEYNQVTPTYYQRSGTLVLPSRAGTKLAAGRFCGIFLRPIQARERDVILGASSLLDDCAPHPAFRAGAFICSSIRSSGRCRADRWWDILVRAGSRGETSPGIPRSRRQWAGL
jgi:hypothetical protein